EQLRPQLALYIGGMGSGTTNFHRKAISRLGYEEACQRIASAWQGGDRAQAVADVPTELVLDVALAGNPAQLRQQCEQWADGLLTTLLIQAAPEAMPTLIEALG